MRSFEAFWVTSIHEDKLVKPVLVRENVIIYNNLTIEVSNEERDKCIDVEDIKVCNNIPAVYHKPGHSDCISKVALNMKEIHETCRWDSDPKSTSTGTGRMYFYRK